MYVSGSSNLRSVGLGIAGSESDILGLYLERALLDQCAILLAHADAQLWRLHVDAGSWIGAQIAVAVEGAYVDGLAGQRQLGTGRLLLEIVARLDGVLLGLQSLSLTRYFSLLCHVMDEVGHSAIEHRQRGLYLFVDILDIDGVATDQEWVAIELLLLVHQLLQVVEQLLDRLLLGVGELLQVALLLLQLRQLGFNAGLMVHAGYAGLEVERSVGMDMDAALAQQGRNGGEGILRIVALQADGTGLLRDGRLGVDHILHTVGTGIDSRLHNVGGTTHDGTRLAGTFEIDVGTADDDVTTRLQVAALIDIADDDLGGGEDDALLVADILAGVQTVEDVALHLLNLYLLLMNLLQVLGDAVLEIGQDFFPIVKYVFHIV